jgi:hypothetical protein
MLRTEILDIIWDNGPSLRGIPEEYPNKVEKTDKFRQMGTT